MNYKKAFSSFSVKNLENSKEFYENILGLDTNIEEEYILQIKVTNGPEVIAYLKPDHTPATFTVLNFVVADLKATVAILKEKGVVFESYDQEDLKTDEDNISRNEMVNVAWFKDPSGNFLSVMEE